MPLAAFHPIIETWFRGRFGLPTDVPTWGNIMAEGRLSFNQYPHNVLFPGVFLALTVLAVNMLGDGLRDTLDPRFGKRGDRL